MTAPRPQFNDFLQATNRGDEGSIITRESSIDSSRASPSVTQVPAPRQSSPTESPARPPVPHCRVGGSAPLLVSGSGTAAAAAEKIINEYKESGESSADAGEKVFSEAEVVELMRRQHSMLARENDQHMQQVSGSSMKYFLKVTPLADIHAHEEVLPERVDQFHDFILSYGLNNPICIPAIIVDISTNVIIDGHHRYYTLRRLGLQEVEMLFIDYRNEDIVVESTANITKEVIIEAALSGKLVRPKLTRHLVLQNGKYVPLLCVSAIISFVLKIGIHQI
jgi:L-serine kinase (ADP)